MLAFIGTIASKDLLSATQLTEVTKPLLYFGFGVAAAVVGSAMAYFTTLMIAESSLKKSRDYQYPFTHGTPSSKKRLVIGEICRWVGAIAVATSIGLFIGGLLQASVAFKLMATTKSSVLSAD
jgi:hypothetical protein